MCQLSETFYGTNPLNLRARTKTLHQRRWWLWNSKREGESKQEWGKTRRDAPILRNLLWHQSSPNLSARTKTLVQCRYNAGYVCALKTLIENIGRKHWSKTLAQYRLCLCNLKTKEKDRKSTLWSIRVRSSYSNSCKMVKLYHEGNLNGMLQFSKPLLRHKSSHISSSRTKTLQPRRLYSSNPKTKKRLQKHITKHSSTFISSKMLKTVA